MGIEYTKIRCGIMPRGKLNKISDVPGITVGHADVRDEHHRTGVTVILPGEDNVFANKRIAASYVHNGFGKTLGNVVVVAVTGDRGSTFGKIPNDLGEGLQNILAVAIAQGVLLIKISRKLLPQFRHILQP